MGDFFPAPSPSAEGVGGVTLPFFSLLWSTLLLPPVVGVASGGCPAVGVWSSCVSSEDEAAAARRRADRSFSACRWSISLPAYSYQSWISRAPSSFSSIHPARISVSASFSGSPSHCAARAIMRGVMPARSPLGALSRAHSQKDTSSPIMCGGVISSSSAASKSLRWSLSVWCT